MKITLRKVWNIGTNDYEFFIHKDAYSRGTYPQPQPIQRKQADTHSETDDEFTERAIGEFNKAVAYEEFLKKHPDQTIIEKEI